MLTKPTAVVARRATKEIRNRLDKLDKDMAELLVLLKDNLVKLDRRLEDQQTLILSLKHKVSELRDNVNLNRAIVTSKQASLVGEIKRDSKILVVKVGIVLLATLSLVKIFFF